TKAKEEFRRRIEELRTQLGEALDRESAIEIDRMLRSITGAFEPYQRFYAAESAKIEVFAGKLKAIDAEAREIHAKVTTL
ncbi:MAG TPA: hypothetical protein VFM36_00565, partial [Thermoanaerobaculia bacterium]|nr:hypothetical protein [Thermoanaerobaculia bacterium]